MKTLRMLCLVLLTTGAALAQPNPDNLFIQGYATDGNGNAQAGVEVCIFGPNSFFPLVDTCVYTNNNGYYWVDIEGGSVTGPNMVFELTVYDSCLNEFTIVSVSNQQGSIDIEEVDFVVCANSGGCSTLLAEITAVPDPSGGGNSTTLNVTASGGTPPYTISWNSNLFGWSPTVSAPGVYCAIITDANGCAFTVCDTVGNSNGGCSVEIIYSSTPLGGDLLTANATGTAPFQYVWSTNDTSQTIDVTGFPGVYCVTITDASGCSSTACYTVPNTGGCFVDIVYTIDPNNPQSYIVSTDPGPGWNIYAWSTGENTQAIYVENPSPNGEVLCVTVTDANGCTATACDTLLPINNGNCFADFWYQTDPNGNLAVEDTVEVLFTGSQGNANTYAWTVTYNGLVWTANTQDLILPVPPTLVPIGGAQVEICVTVSDALTGCSDTYCETVMLVQSNSGGFGGTITTTVDSTLIGLTYTFAANATGTAPFTYAWFDGSTNQVVVFDPANINWNGIACVTITDATGCVVTVCDTVNQNPNPNLCVASFNWAESNILGSPLPAVEFTDQSTGAAYWYWDFGDNTFSQDQNPLHTYNSAGTYMVCLTIVNTDQTCQQTYCDTVVVGNSGNGNCSAAFSNSGPTPIGYTFSANVQNSNLYYSWSIDNQYVGNGFEAYAPGLSNGVHTICLTIIDSLIGCSDTQCQTITVGSSNCYGYVAGQVYAGSNNQPLDHGVVYLILFDPNTNQLTAIDSMVVDSGNYYFFGPLACGDYLVKAASYPNSQYYSNHIPTYYGNSPFWAFAQTVTIGQVNVQVTADIFLIAANNPGGPGFIGGDVTQGANKTDPGDPLSGMQVMLFDLSGNAIAYTYTDGNGEFGFSDLAWGTYQVYVEALGVQTIPAVVTIGPNMPSVEDVHILASESLISTGIEEFDYEGAISDVYPNPVFGDAAISLNLENEVMVDVSIVDLAGRVISTNTVSIAAGESRLSVDSEGLNAGYYFLSIQDVEGNFSITRKFMRVD
jgi:PKD repeat protein